LLHSQLPYDSFVYIYKSYIQQLEAELINDTYINVGKKYGVSDNTIRSWIKQYKKKKI